MELKSALVVVVALLLGRIQGCFCWDQEDLDLFDLVEEVGQSFYEVLQVDESASAAEIRRAYRQLSLQLHPDKSDDLDAAEKFRTLVAVAEVLRDEEKRARYDEVLREGLPEGNLRYDEVLREGLPDWRQAVYYYRRVRKMGLAEILLLLFVMASVGHYLFGWAVYLEKLLVLQEVMEKKQKKVKRQRQSRQLDAEVEFHTAQANANLPQLRNLLPFILARKLLALTKLCWSSYCQWRTMRAKARAASCMDTAITGHLRDDTPHSTGKCGVGSNSRRGCRETEKDWNSSSQSMQLQKSRTNKKSAQNESNHTILMKSSTYRDANGGSTTDSQQCKDERPLDNSGVLGQGEDSSRRYRVQNRDPGGELESTTAPDQPKKMAERNSNESNSPHTSSPQLPSPPPALLLSSSPPALLLSSSPPALLLPSPPPALLLSSSPWTQYQQRQLEWALSHYPKFAKDRWDNIARAVPGKSKTECIERCKELFETVRKRKQQLVHS